MVGSKVLSHKGFDLHFHPAANRQHPETIILVHHMWGSHRTTSRHYQFLNQLGYDCVSFDLLLGSSEKPLSAHPLCRFFYKGVFYIWYKQIQIILDFIEGDKIIFAFSGPSMSSFWAADGRSDIKKFICDGGPFTMIYENTTNFFHNVVGIKNPWLAKTSAWFGTAVWGFYPLQKIHKVLGRWQQVPILSIRGTEDDIVAIDSIEQIFSPHPQLNLKVLEIEKGRHLNGLRDFPEVYKKRLQSFLIAN